MEGLEKLTSQPGDSRQTGAKGSTRYETLKWMFWAAEHWRVFSPKWVSGFIRPLHYDHFTKAAGFCVNLAPMNTPGSAAEKYAC